MAKRSLLRRVLGVGVLAGAAYAVWRAIEAKTAPAGEGWEPQPFPFPPQPRAPDTNAVTNAVTNTATDEPPELAPWVEPVDGGCPADHPVKAKISSGIFHVADGQMYDRTTPDRCYRDAPSAEADGLRRSKR